MPLQNFYTDSALEAGCDEAGRGCLAGPVVAAAVILPRDFYHPLLNDSKQVSKANRELLREVVEKESLAWAVEACSPQEIDEINILNASFLAMHRALDHLTTVPEYILVDGNRFKKYKNIIHSCMVKGDARFTSIAAASILAKTHRDEIMEKLHQNFPDYSWATNMGYPTIAHRKAIERIGASEHHRMTFRLLKEQLELF
jgi:ribonuclease HII